MLRNVSQSKLNFEMIGIIYFKFFVLVINQFYQNYHIHIKFYSPINCPLGIIRTCLLVKFLFEMLANYLRNGKCTKHKNW